MVVTACIALGLFVVFAVVPDRLSQLIERRSRSAILRDLILTAWFTAGVGAACWALVRLQRRRII